MARSRYDETADHVDLLDRLDAIDPPRVRVLTLAHHVEDPDQTERVWELDGTVVIGRDPGAGGIEICDPGSSRRHARIVHDEDRDVFTVEDLGSRNGTFVDGTRAAKAELEHGSVVRIADSTFVFSEADLPEGLPRPRLSPTASILREVVEARATLAARAPLSLLLLGPTGAGKERLAKQIHEASGRPGRLVAVNCGALNRELIASELFGHAAGAFSGASGDRSGLFVAADRGTLFLDEIADLPLDQQPSLLRTLQEKTVRPVGSDVETAVDVRVVAATHKSLDVLVEQGTFRRDLYARLSGMVLRLPGLADRREEVLPLFTQMASMPLHAISADAAEALLLHDWPQNVREVQHLAAQIQMFDQRGLELPSLPPEFAANLTSARKRKPEAEAQPVALDRSGLVALLEEHQGNVATIAKLLGKHRAQVYRWLRKEGLDPDHYRG
ncbi:MAG: sigma 54-interacting transcriptional regulator [Deltaproteobacteria bacterium]